MNEVASGRDHTTPASVRHDDDEPLTPISPHYVTRAASLLTYCSSSSVRRILYMDAKARQHLSDRVHCARATKLFFKKNLGRVALLLLFSNLLVRCRVQSYLEAEP